MNSIVRRVTTLVSFLAVVSTLSIVFAHAAAETAKFTVNCPTALRTQTREPVFFGNEQVGSVRSVKSKGKDHEFVIEFSAPIRSFSDAQGIEITADSDAMVILDANSMWVVMEPGGDTAILQDGAQIQFADCLTFSHPSHSWCSGRVQVSKTTRTIDRWRRHSQLSRGIPSRVAFTQLAEPVNVRSNHLRRVVCRAWMGRMPSSVEGSRHVTI